MVVEKELVKCTKFKVVSRELVLPNGLHVDREIVVHPGAVVIIPVADDGELIMLKQYRPAVDQYLIEFPAGTLEADEEHRYTAERELIEETGFQAEQLEYLGQLIPSPGFCDEIQHLYIAKQLSFVGAAPEPGEIIEELRVSVADFAKMVAAGEILDCKTIAAFTKAEAMGFLANSIDNL